MIHVFKHHMLLGLSSVIWFLTACSADSESVGKGTCSLKCSTGKVAASNFAVKLLNDVTAMESQCFFPNDQAATTPQTGPVQLRFLVYEKVESFSTVVGSAGSTTGGTTTGGPGSALVSEVPRAGIGFEPFVYGQVALEKSAQGYNAADKSVTPFKYAGIVTPAAEWCTDTCGVATVEVWPLCVRGKSNTVKAGIFVEGVSSMPSFTITTNGT